MASFADDPACHELELRDPTHEELYSGPTRELPVEIQQMAVEDTACTFCGVSYFVFAEVQELQKTVKKYKKTFHDFVHFLERERKISQDLKVEVLEMKRGFEQISGAFSSNAKQIALEHTQLRQVNEENSSRLFEARREVDKLQEIQYQLQNQTKRAEEEWRIQSSLTEQKLRNEIIHLSSQIENCKLLSSTQESEFTAQFEREKRKMKELEAKFAENQESWALTERLMVTDRDQMKQKLLSMTECVGEEKNAAKQLEAQLKAVQQELSRIVSSNDAERSAFSRLNSGVVMLKHQLQTSEKNKALLLTERTQLQEEKATHEQHISQLNIQVCTLQKKIEENVLTTEKIKQEYVKELKKMRSEHSNDLHRLRQDHAKAVEDLKATQKEYIDFLKKETSEVQLGAESTSLRAHELEKQLNDAALQARHWKDEAERSVEELKYVRMSNVQSNSLIATLETKITTLQGDKNELETEIDALQRQLDLQKEKTMQQVGKVEREMLKKQQQLEAQNLALQKRADALQEKLKQVEAEYAQRAPAVAWEDTKRGYQSARSANNPNGAKITNNRESSNQESHEQDRVIEKLRLNLEQKDRVSYLVPWLVAIGERILSGFGVISSAVHCECLERTSLLEKMRSGKILPDTASPYSSQSGDFSRWSSKNGKMDGEITSTTDEDESNRETAERSGTPTQPKASLYEKLRKAGQRKPKSRK